MASSPAAALPPVSSSAPAVAASVPVAPPEVVVSEPLPAPLFKIEPLQVATIPRPDAPVPDDVAAAVRRALQAIENASTGGVSVSAMDLTPPTVPVADLVTSSLVIAIDPVDVAPLVDQPSEPAPTTDPAAARELATGLASATAVPSAERSRTTAPVVAEVPARPAPLGFSPPTDDMRAEAVYARAVAEAEAAGATTGGADPLLARSGDQRGRASVVFVDEEVEESTERRSALRRLISNLRHKDD